MVKMAEELEDYHPGFLTDYSGLLKEGIEDSKALKDIKDRELFLAMTKIIGQRQHYTMSRKGIEETIRVFNEESKRRYCMLK